MPADTSFSEITHGPAQLVVDGTDMGHTQGGVTIRVAPQQRQRTVDEYGNSPIEVIHQGDEVRVTAPLAQWNADVLGEVYAPGNNQLGGIGPKYLGVGRKSGFIYPKKEVSVTPLVSVHGDRSATFWAATPVGEMEFAHNNDDDRILNAEFVCCVDYEDDSYAARTDGELIGRIYLDDTGA